MPDGDGDGDGDVCSGPGIGYWSLLTSGRFVIGSAPWEPDNKEAQKT